MPAVAHSLVPCSAQQVADGSGARGGALAVPTLIQGKLRDAKLRLRGMLRGFGLKVSKVGATTRRIAPQNDHSVMMALL